MNKILEQSEVKALLQGLSDEELEPETSSEEENSDALFYDFSSQNRHIQNIKTLKAVSSRFSGLASQSISNALRRKVGVKPVFIRACSVRDFMSSLAAPAAVNIFKMYPYSGKALMVMDACLIFSIVENLFGGSGNNSRIKPREFTPIEQNVITRIASMLLDNLEDAWRAVHVLKIENIRCETDPGFSHIGLSRETTTLLNFEMILNDGVSGSINVCLPFMGETISA